MNRFAELLDRLVFEGARNAKIELLADYLSSTPDPDRGYALAAITGSLSFKHAKPAVIRALIAERTDPVLFAMSYDYVGDLSETVALMWPAPIGGAALQGGPDDRLRLSHIVATLDATGKAQAPQVLAGLLDGLDEKGRWALLKLITGALRIGVSARLAKTALASLRDIDVNEIEEVWPGLEPPYEDLFAWLEDRGPKPLVSTLAPFRPAMLAHAIDEGELETMVPEQFSAEWKWDGIRIQASAGGNGENRLARLYSRTGDDISHAFPEIMEALHEERFGHSSIDGELLVVRQGNVGSFSDLQQRLNRKTVSRKMLTEFPAHIRAYDMLAHEGEDLRNLTFAERRARLEDFIAHLDHPRFDLSPLVPFENWDVLRNARARPDAHGAGADAAAVEGVMLKRRDAPYVPGRPKGLWYKWKRDPFIVDAVLMYAQRGHGKRSSFYSDFTFGVWRATGQGEEIVPVGKAYFGFTDEELRQLDKYVRDNTRNRFGPVREVGFGKDEGLVLEIAFEGLQKSTRHKSGLAMRFPRISRIRWDKPANEADNIEELEKLLER